MNLPDKDRNLLVRLGAIFLGIATLLLIVIGISYIKSYGYIGASAIENATIAVTGEGESFAVPDVAEFYFTVEKEAATVSQAQEAVTEKANTVLAYLKSAGVEEKDIKTTSYDIHPRYEYRRTANSTTVVYPGQGTRVLVGFSVSEGFSVKVRKTEKAGEILSQVGKLNVSNVSGLQFSVDDEDAAKNEARTKAIAEAKTKAQALAKDLNVDLVQVVDFQESGSGDSPRPIYGVMDMKAESAGFAATPELPTGQNKFTSSVTITYKIK